MILISDPQNYYLSILRESSEDKFNAVILVYLSNMLSKFNSYELPTPLFNILESANNSKSPFERMNNYRKLGDCGILMASLFANNGARIGLSETYYKDMSIIGYSNITTNRPIYSGLCDNIDEIVPLIRKAVGGSFLDPLNVK